MTRDLISIVIPVMNEEENLAPLHEEIATVLKEEGLRAEIIYVDDGSTDSSWSRIEALADGDSRVLGLKLRRNFGKAAALRAAFGEASGRFVFTLDADLQDDPKELPKMLARLESDCDMVTGWKRKRNDPWHKVMPSRVFNGLVGAITGLKLHDHNCGIKGYRGEVVKELNLYGELHRFITVMAHARGFRVEEIEVNHRSRIHGSSKYGARRFLHGLLDLLTVRFLTGYGERPLHVLGLPGLVLTLAGVAGLGYLALLWMLGYRPIGTRPLLFYSIAALQFGAQMVTFGMLAELFIWRSSGQSNGTAQLPRVSRRTKPGEDAGSMRP